MFNELKKEILIQEKEEIQKDLLRNVILDEDSNEEELLLGEETEEEYDENDDDYDYEEDFDEEEDDFGFDEGDEDDETWSYEHKGVSDTFINPIKTAKALRQSIDKVLKKDYPVFLYIVFPEHTELKKS